MRHILDYRGVAIRLTDERLDHMVTNHPDVAQHVSEIDLVLRDPEIVVQSIDDAAAHLYYRATESPDFDEVQMCVVAVVLSPSPFVLTAYFTDRVKQGREIWRRR